MSDTDTPVAQRYRTMILSRPAGERLKMGCSMDATARELVRASALAANPQASPAEVRRTIFLRLYGSEFDGGERERVLAWLADRP
jgi:hypothetical protein